MVEKNEMRMAELLSSKLCHDLISPIGAIVNGLELLREESFDMANEAANLVGSSARQAADRLAYFRAAFGAAGLDDTIEFDTVLDLIEKLAAEKKREIVWTGAETYAHTKIIKACGKLILNLTLIAFDCLPRGGQIEISLEGKEENNLENLDLLVSISGEKCTLREDVKSGFESDISEDSLSVRNILPVYCKKLANECQKTLKLTDESPSLIVFRVS